jgi:NADPH:quinone reductase-like Zn-dependent oxidoreductase
MMRMKTAVIYETGGPQVLRYEEMPDPDCPDGCVVVDAEAISRSLPGWMRPAPLACR